MWYDETGERRGSYWERTEALEKAMFGFRRPEDGVWVDGLLQQMADIRRFIIVGGWVVTTILSGILIATGTEVANNVNGWWGAAHAAKVTTNVLTKGKP